MAQLFERFFFHTAFHGQAYHGWQWQPKANTVQEELEKAFERVLKLPISVNGCGRTDAGVHASQYIFHSDLPPDLDFNLVERLNFALPPDIAIYEQFKVHPKAHARYDAIERQYDYYIHTEKNPLLLPFSAFYPLPHLDLDLMQQAVACLPKYEDFRAFCRSPDQQDHTVCRVKSAHLQLDNTGTRLHFQIVANRFLRGMIRIIVGRLLEVGTGKMSVEAFEYHLRERVTPKVLRPAHANGLQLSRVVYPYLECQPRSGFVSF